MVTRRTKYTMTNPYSALETLVVITTIATLTTIGLFTIMSVGWMAQAQSMKAETKPDLISTGNPRYDQFDSFIIDASNRYGVTDKLMVKALIMQESYFDSFLISQDSPCGIPDGWTDPQSRSFGLTQVTPACGEADGNMPNLTTDKNSTHWATSLFNPEFNVYQGVQELSDNLSLMKSKFPACSNEQYMLMALGGYNSGEDAIHGCNSWNGRASEYISNVTERYRTLSQLVNMFHPN